MTKTVTLSTLARHTDIAQSSNSTASAGPHTRPHDIQGLICDEGSPRQQRTRRLSRGHKLKVSPGASTDPLHWWRKLGAGQFGESERAVIGVILDGFALTHHEQAKLFAGELSEIIPLLPEAFNSICLDARTDLLMTALLRCALAGNFTARLLLRKALSKRGGLDPTLYQLSRTWFRHRHAKFDVP